MHGGPERSGRDGPRDGRRRSVGIRRHTIRIESRKKGQKEVRVTDDDVSACMRDPAGYHEPLRGPTSRLSGVCDLHDVNLVLANVDLYSLARLQAFSHLSRVFIALSSRRWALSCRMWWEASGFVYQSVGITVLMTIPPKAPSPPANPPYRNPR